LLTIQVGQSNNLLETGHSKIAANRKEQCSSLHRIDVFHFIHTSLLLIIFEPPGPRTDIPMARTNRTRITVGITRFRYHEYQDNII